MRMVSVLLPNSLYSPVEMPASRDRVIRSPRLAAIGVATLSGLMPTFLDAMITPIMTRPVGVSGQRHHNVKTAEDPLICDVICEVLECNHLPSVFQVNFV